MEKKSIWSLAAINGLYLSLITIIYSLITINFKIESTIVSFILWAIKFAACIYVLYYFMKKYSEDKESVTYGESFKYDFLTCVFSTIICSCFSFVCIEYLYPEQTEQIINAFQEGYGSADFSSEQENMFNKIFGNLGKITLFGSLVYYTILGAIFSAIIANYTKKDNPFSKGSDIE